MAKLHIWHRDDDRHKIFVVAVLTSFVFIYGIAGYMLIEGWGFLDALYMTLITISTVGYGETNPVGSLGRIFTITLIFFGVGTFLFLAGSVMQVMVEGRLRRILGRVRVDKKLSKLSGHYIVCGYGRIGRALCKTLKHDQVDVVAIERNADRIPAMREDQVLHVLGVATDESNLLRAGIERAKGLVTVVGDDTDNVFLVLTAKQLNPKLTVVSRANRRETIKTLYAAGADQVVSPFEIGGRRIANAILRPTVMSFLDQAGTDVETDIHIEEVVVEGSSSLQGKSLLEASLPDRLNLLVIAIEKPDGNMLFNPSAETTLIEGDTIVVIGQGEHLQELKALLASG